MKWADLRYASGMEILKGLSIRGCRPADLDRVCRIERTCHGSDNALRRIALTQYLELYGPAFALAELSSRIIGFAVGGVALSNDFRIGWLLDAAVQPDFQGHSVGQVICRHVLDRLLEYGVRTVRATVAPTNGPSLKLLQKLEFSMHDDIADYFGPGQRRLLMERQWRA
jgi:ribosomal protein S18 acetylase RimI-like enzyme